jgi:hypothetical protein
MGIVRVILDIHVSRFSGRLAPRLQSEGFEALFRLRRRRRVPAEAPCPAGCADFQ